MKSLRVGIMIGLMASLVLMVGNANAESKAVFGVKPGILIQSSYFGIDAKRWHPFAGMDLVAFAISEDEYDASASVWIPHFGTKLYLQDPWQAGKVAPYIQGDYFFSIASVNVDDYDSGEEELVEEVLEFWDSVWPSVWSITSPTTLQLAVNTAFASCKTKWMSIPRHIITVAVIRMKSTSTTNSPSRFA